MSPSLLYNTENQETEAISKETFLHNWHINPLTLLKETARYKIGMSSIRY